MGLKEIDIKDFSVKPFSLIGDEWMLITSGDEKSYNTMTASWGGVGVLWNKNVAFSFIRPQRYTFEFVEKNEYYTLSFYPDNMKQALTICGRKSGRDCNKVKEAGLSPIFNEKAPYFEGAKLVLICKKLYNQFLTPECFVEKELEINYPNKDYHKMYIGEIVKALINE